ncbi:hypothetical protein HWV62_31257 [Athelia sp. TMB]|nr:hypothetical protein HWV62_31257 [Athelia sp. TMB]
MESQFCRQVRHPSSLPKLTSVLLVVLVSLLDTLHTAFMCHTNYFYLVEGITNPALRIDGIWSFYASTGVNAFLAFIVQTFFLYRTHRLVKRYWRWRISCIMMTLILAHLGAALYNTEKYFGGNLMETKSAAFNASHTFDWVALDFIFGKVQTNALLAILNARRAIKGQGIDEDGTSTTTSRHTANKKTVQIQRARTRGTRVSSLRRMGSVSDDSVYDIGGSMALHSSDFAASEAITSSGPGVESVV